MHLVVEVVRAPRPVMPSVDPWVLFGAMRRSAPADSSLTVPGCRQGSGLSFCRSGGGGWGLPIRFVFAPITLRVTANLGWWASLRNCSGFHHHRPPAVDNFLDRGLHQGALAGAAFKFPTTDRLRA